MPSQPELPLYKPRPPPRAVLPAPWEEGGQTIFQILSSEQPTLYRQWVNDRQALKAVLEEMRDPSREAVLGAAEHLASEADVDLVGPSRPRARRRGGAERHMELQNPGT